MASGAGLGFHRTTGARALTGPMLAVLARSTDAVPQVLRPERFARPHAWMADILVAVGNCWFSVGTLRVNQGPQRFTRPPGTSYGIGTGG